MHKLTEKIKRIAFEKPSHHVEELDSIIREELGKMAEDIAGAINKSGKGRLALECDQLELNRILGLTDGGEVGDSYCNKCKKNLRDCKCPERSSAPYGEWRDAPEKPKQVVCDIEHDYRYFIFNRINVCPHCGAESPVVVVPRPKEKTLVEKVSEVLSDVYIKRDDFPENNECSIEMAKAAIAVMEKEMRK